MSNLDGSLLNFLIPNGKNKCLERSASPPSVKFNKKKQVTTKKSKAEAKLENEKLHPEIIDEVSFDSFLNSFSKKMDTNNVHKTDHLTSSIHHNISATHQKQDDIQFLNASESPKPRKIKQKDFFSKFKYIPCESDSNSNDNSAVTENFTEASPLQTSKKIAGFPGDDSFTNPIISKLVSPSSVDKNENFKKSTKIPKKNSQSSFNMETWCGRKQKESLSISIDLVDIEESENVDEISSFQSKENYLETCVSKEVLIEKSADEIQLSNSPVIECCESKHHVNRNLVESPESPKIHPRRSLRRREVVEYSKIQIFGDVPNARKKNKTKDNIVPSMFDPTTWRKPSEEKKGKGRLLKKTRKSEPPPVEDALNSSEEECVVVKDERPPIDEEKRNFLMSGLPQILKKQIGVCDLSLGHQLEAPFPQFNHVHSWNSEDSCWLSNLPSINNSYKMDSMKVIKSTPCLAENLHFLGRPDFVQKKLLCKRISKENRVDYLDSIKSQNSAFPVKRFFKALMERYLNFESADKPSEDIAPEVSYPPWSEKYAPINSTSYLGNSNRVQKLKNWLQKWRIKTDRESRKLARQLAKEKKKRKKKELPKEETSDDDFRLSDCPSESESEHSEVDNEISQTMLITGPHGVGKTILATSLATELDYKVFEVNASSKRSGKDVLQQLLAAVESQHVAKDNLSSVFSTFEMTKNFQATQPTKSVKQNRKRKMDSDFFNPKAKKAKLESTQKAPSKSPKTIQKSDSSKKGLSLKSCSVVLFDEVDLVFDEDKGFWSAISTFMQTNTRPIIMTTSDDSFLHKFGMQDRIELCSLIPSSPAYLASYLSTVCLVEGYFINPTFLEEIVFHYNSDLRRCLNALQMYLSHCCEEDFTTPIMLPVLDNQLVDSHNRLGFEFAQKLLNVRGTRRTLTPNTQNSDHPQNDIPDKNCSLNEIFNSDELGAEIKESQSNSTVEMVLEDRFIDDTACGPALELLASYYDSLSMLDISRIECHIMEPGMKPSCEVKEASNLKKDFANNRSNDLRSDLARCWSICWENQFDLKELEMNLNLPDRKNPSPLWKLDIKQKSETLVKHRHHQNILKSLPLSLRIQKSSFGMDYLPSLRSIVQSEEMKKLQNRKRRYFHYFDKISLYMKEAALNFLKQEIVSESSTSPDCS